MALLRCVAFRPFVDNPVENYLKNVEKWKNMENLRSVSIANAEIYACFYFSTSSNTVGTRIVISM